MKQDIRNGQFDILTAGELSKALHEHFHESRWSRFWRTAFAGVKVLKLPLSVETAASSSLTLFNNDTGPRSGFIWVLRRVTVLSNLADDTATWSLYVGSDSNAPLSACVDMIPNGTGKIGQAYYPASKGIVVFPDEYVYATISSSTQGTSYMMTGLVVEAPIEMQGKIVE